MDNTIQEDTRVVTNIATPPQVTDNMVFFGQDTKSTKSTKNTKNTKSTFSKNGYNVIRITFYVIALIMSFRHNIKYGFNLIDVLFALIFPPVYIIYRAFFN